MSSNPGIGFTLFAADYEGDADAVMALMLEALRSPSPDRFALEHIADMIDPSKKQTKFRLKLYRRKGNRDQIDDGWLDRVNKVSEIYCNLILEGYSHKAAITETVKRGEMSVADGGVGKSSTTIRGYLDAYFAHAEAQNED